MKLVNEDYVRLNIPDTVTGIGASAFSYCSSLGNLTIPSSVEEISGRWPFYYCESLTVYYEGTKEEWKEVCKCSSEISEIVTIHFSGSSD